jgi:hypothetical protein
MKTKVFSAVTAALMTIVAASTGRAHADQIAPTNAVEKVQPGQMPFF